MRKILSIFPVVLLLLLVLPGSVSAATTVNVNDVISTSKTNGSPLGDCVGPDKKHFQTTKEVCDALNKAWGKSVAPFNVGVPSPIAPPATISEAVVIAQVTNSPAGDCVGPDKKHLQAAKEVCDVLNKSWGKTDVAFAPGTSTLPVPGSVAEIISKAQSADVPKGDCIGPDKKHVQTTKEACDALNHAWGKAVAPFAGPSISAPAGSSGTSGGGTSGGNSPSSGSNSGSGSSSSGSSKSSAGSTSSGSKSTSGSGPSGSSSPSGNSTVTSGGNSGSSATSNSGSSKNSGKTENKEKSNDKSKK